MSLYKICRSEGAPHQITQGGLCVWHDILQKLEDIVGVPVNHMDAYSRIIVVLKFNNSHRIYLEVMYLQCINVSKALWGDKEYVQQTL